MRKEKSSLQRHKSIGLFHSRWDLHAERRPHFKALHGNAFRAWLNYFSFQKTTRLLLNELCKKIRTYRTVSMAHERNETFPMDSMRFPSKSLREHVGKGHKGNSSKTQLGFVQYVLQSTWIPWIQDSVWFFFRSELTASSVWASLCRCHPDSSKSCSAKLCQPGETQFPLPSVNLYQRSLR